MTQHELIPMLIGFGLIIFFGLLIYYIRHLQNSHAKERARLINEWEKRFLDVCSSLNAAKEETKAVRGILIDQNALIDEVENAKISHENMHVAMQDAVEKKKAALESLADTKRLLDLELQDREQHEALIDQQNAMILELKDMVKNLIQKGKEVDQVFIDDILKLHVEGMSQLRAEEMERSRKILEEAEKNGTYTGRPDYVGFAKSPRPINNLKENEAIQVNNDAERDGILDLMEIEEWTWRGTGHKPRYYAIKAYPHLLLKDNEGIGWLSCSSIEEEDFTILPASDFLPKEQKDDKSEVHTKNADVTTIDTTGTEQADKSPTELPPTRDWSKPQAFPENYIIPEGVRVVKTADDDDWVRKGSIGLTRERSKDPFIKWENKDYNLSIHDSNWCQPSHYLAPIEPQYHPEHPQFKGKK